MNEKYLQDLWLMIDTLESEHPNIYQYCSRHDIEAIIKEFLPINGKKEFSYLIKRIFKVINDPHTQVFNALKKAPFEFKIINNQVYLIATTEEYKDYLYWELIAINNRPIGDIIFELKKIIPFHQDSFADHRLEVILNQKWQLSSLPMFINNDSFEYTFKKDNNKVSLTFETEGKYDIKPGLRMGEGGDFSLEPNYSYELINDILKINYRRCYEDPEYLINDFKIELEKMIQEHNIKKIVFDLRGNGGGKSSTISPIIEMLSQHNCVVATLINNAVFSSGIWTLGMLSELGSVTIGTGIGDYVNGFGHVKELILPNSNFKVQFSTKYFYLLENNRRGKGGQLLGPKEFKSFFSKPENQFLLKPVEFIPDIYCENNIQDYEQGRDTQLEKAIEYLTKINNKSNSR